MHVFTTDDIINYQQFCCTQKNWNNNTYVCPLVAKNRAASTDSNNKHVLISIMLVTTTAGLPTSLLCSTDRTMYNWEATNKTCSRFIVELLNELWISNIRDKWAYVKVMRGNN